MDQSRRFSAFVASGRDPRPTIREALEFARDYLTQSCLDERAYVKAAIIVEELISNCLRHGGGAQDLSVSLVLEDIGDAIVLEVEDDGPAFDPTTGAGFSDDFAGPDPETGGGIGLAIVRAWGEDIAYTHNGQRNILRLTIR